MTQAATTEREPGHCTGCRQPVNPPGLLRCRPCAADPDPDTPTPWRHVHADLQCRDCGQPRPEFHDQCYDCTKTDTKG